MVPLLWCSRRTTSFARLVGIEPGLEGFMAAEVTKQNKDIFVVCTTWDFTSEIYPCKSPYRHQWTVPDLSAST
jgi:hypothetical protein